MRSELPKGTVTFLFTDIEGSTRLLQELGGGYADVLAEHHRVLRDVWARHSGVEVDTAGDAFFVAFARASDAVAAAADAQNALASALFACGWVSTRASRLSGARQVRRHRCASGGTDRGGGVWRTGAALADDGGLAGADVRDLGDTGSRT